MNTCHMQVSRFSARAPTDTNPTQPRSRPRLLPQAVGYRPDVMAVSARAHRDAIPVVVSRPLAGDTAVLDQAMAQALIQAPCTRPCTRPYPEIVPKVLVTGMSGTGKSTVLRVLAQRRHRVVDTDTDQWSQ